MDSGSGKPLAAGAAEDTGARARPESAGGGPGLLRRLPRTEDAGWLFAILVLALLPRGVWAGLVAVDPNDGRLDDSVFYHNVAVSLARHHEFTNPLNGFPTAQWPPGYPFFLAGIYRLFGPTLYGARLANMLLSAGTAALVYLLALRLFDRRSALLAALLAAVFPGQVFFVSVLYSEILFTFMFVLALLLIVVSPGRAASRRAWWLVCLGVLAGAAALVRGQGLFLLPMAFAAWLLLGVPRARAFRWTIAVTGLALAVILPWTVRNYLVLGSPVFITSSLGGNLYTGHNDAGSDPIGPLIEEYGPLTKRGAEVKVGEVALRRGLRFMFTHPRDEMRLTAEKIRDLYRSDRSGLDLVEGYRTRKIMDDAARSALDHLADGFYFWVLAAAGLALVHAAHRREGAVLVPVVVVGLWTAGSVLFFGDPRFHFPIIPVFCVLAGRLAAVSRPVLLAAAPALMGVAVLPQVFAV